MTHLTRIASYGQTNPLPIPETAHLTLEQRRDYTFVITLDNGDNYLVEEKIAQAESPLIEHMNVGDVFYLMK